MKNKSYKKRLNLLNLTTLEERRVRGDSIQWYKIKNKIEEVKFITEPGIRDSRTRGGKKGECNLLDVKKPVREEFFINRALKTWNKLPDSVVKACSVNSFKRLYDIHCQGCHSQPSTYGELHEA